LIVWIACGDGHLAPHPHRQAESLSYYSLTAMTQVYSQFSDEPFSGHRNLLIIDGDAKVWGRGNETSIDKRVVIRGSHVIARRCVPATTGLGRRHANCYG
jgi:hypothetical protein